MTAGGPYRERMLVVREPAPRTLLGRLRSLRRRFLLLFRGRFLKRYPERCPEVIGVIKRTEADYRNENGSG